MGGNGLQDLAALCNQFALRLFHLGFMQLAHAFFTRVMSFTHMSSPGDYPWKYELYGWTCDLVALCLWKQTKFEVLSPHHPPPSPAPFSTRDFVGGGRPEIEFSCPPPHPAQPRPRRGSDCGAGGEQEGVRVWVSLSVSL